MVAQVHPGAFNTQRITLQDLSHGQSDLALMCDQVEVYAMRVDLLPQPIPMFELLVTDVTIQTAMHFQFTVIILGCDFQFQQAELFVGSAGKSREDQAAHFSSRALPTYIAG